jgi:cystathionine beta-lyase/cystathionine gamma-synthase
MASAKYDFDTLAIQAGLRQGGEDWRATAPPIHPSTTFTYPSVAAVHHALEPMGGGYAYSRNANPTVATLEQALRALEGTEDAVAFASGMAAIHAAILATGIRPGDALLAAKDLYGVSHSLFTGPLAAFGIKPHFVDVLDLAAVRTALIESRARVLVFESLSNPLLRVPDVAALIELAHEAGALVIVDNTFASPYLLRPAALGADIVVHSATKYLSGHGDVIAGVVATDSDFGHWLRDLRTTTGGVLGPFEAWLTLRGMRTLPLRMRRHCENAAMLAAWLEHQDCVERVHYPGLPSHPHYARVRQLFRDGLGGGMVAFELRTTAQGVEAFMDALELAVAGTSLGDVETLVLYPARSSHRTLTVEERVASGITDSLVRVSVGLESSDDIIADFKQALSRLQVKV